MPEENIFTGKLAEFDPASKKLFDDAQTLYNEFVTGRMRAGNLPGDRDRSPRGQAVDRILQVMEKYPDDPRPLNLYGAILHGMGELPEAEFVLQKALSTGFSSFNLHLLLAEICLEREAFNEVESHIGKMMEFDKTRPEIYEISAEMAEQRGQNDKRLEALGKLLEIQPNDVRIVVAYALTLARTGKLKEAVAKLEAFSESNPASAEVQFTLANLYTDTDRIKDALAEYKRVLELNPDHNMARFEYANLLDEIDKHQEALTIYKEYLEVIKEDPDAYYNAAGVAERVENHALAVTYYLQFLRFTNSSDDFNEVIEWLNENAPGIYDESELQIGIARALVEQDDPESVLREISIVRGMDVDNRRVNMLEGLALQELGEFSESVKFFEKALCYDDACDEEGFTDDDILIAAGETFLELKKYSEAQETAKEIIKGETKAEDGYTLLGDIELEAERLDSAHDYFKKSLSVNMFSFGGLFGLGEVFDSKEQYSFAATSFRQCLDIEPEDADSLYRYGMDNIRLGYQEWGKFYLEKYLKLYPDGDYIEDIKKVLKP
jgi:tetratricopeptide (TPR) repeat protein